MRLTTSVVACDFMSSTIQRAKVNDLCDQQLQIILKRFPWGMRSIVKRFCGDALRSMYTMGHFVGVKRYDYYLADELPQPISQLVMAKKLTREEMEAFHANQPVTLQNRNALVGSRPEGDRLNDERIKQFNANQPAAECDSLVILRTAP